jgi:hypothetical protein
MTDALAGRRILEFFGLLAIAPADSKKQDQVLSPFIAPQTKKVAAVEQTRKSK